MENQHFDESDDRDKTIGKFNTAEDLLSAYNALESEFTKRCQLIKKLQAELDGIRAQADDPSSRQSLPADSRQAENETRPSAREDGDTDGGDGTADGTDESAVSDVDTAADVAREAPVPEISGQADCPSAFCIESVLKQIADNAAECAEMLADIPEIMAACITRYKHKLIGHKGCGAAPGGAAVIVPAKRPVTLADAKRLADELLSSDRF